jgi:hypothetical protein
MKDKIITKELAKLYEKQGYLKDSLTCYQSLYEETKDHEFADAIGKIKNKINPQEEKEDKDNTQEQSPSSELKKKGKGNKALDLFEEWLNMLILEKKIQNFKKVQQNLE